MKRILQNIKDELHNPIFYSVMAFILGAVIAAWGYDKNESTIAMRTHGAIFMIWLGSVSCILGGIGMFVFGNSKR